jgi:hypothetical protein
MIISEVRSTGVLGSRVLDAGVLGLHGQPFGLRLGVLHYWICWRYQQLRQRLNFSGPVICKIENDMRLQEQNLCSCCENLLGRDSRTEPKKAKSTIVVGGWRHARHSCDERKTLKAA